MAIEITIPRLGWSMEEGVFAEWLKAPGDWVSSGDPVFALESDKALQEVEAVDEGYLWYLPERVRAGMVLKVGSLIGYLLAKGEVAPSDRSIPNYDDTQSAASLSAAPSNDIPSSPTKVASSIASSEISSQPALPKSTQWAAVANPSVIATPATRRLARELGIDWTTIKASGTVSRDEVLLAAAGKPIHLDTAKSANMEQRGAFPKVARRNENRSLPKISPRAAALATQLGLDWTRIKGSGAGGRIREIDIRTSSARRTEFSPAPLATEKSFPHPNELPTQGKLQKDQRVRKIIAERMRKALQRTAPVTLHLRARADRLVEYRKRLKDSQTRPLPSINDLLVWLAARAIVSEPRLNATWTSEGVFVYEHVNICIAIDTEKGLLAPIIRDADRLSLDELVTSTRTLVDRTRSGRLESSELAGGTFTVTNLGMLDIDHFNPIINEHQSAILGVGRLSREPVVEGNELKIGEVLGLSLTFDHCVIDGAPAARWLHDFARRIENFSGAAD